METIRFDIKHGDFGDCVEPVINGQSLISILKEVELPQALVEGIPSIAGGYCGVPKSVVKPPSQHLLGNAKKRFTFVGKTTLLDCQCGESGCWPFVVNIKFDEKTVRWENFEQVHRKDWKYDDLEPFVFSRDEYEKEMAAIADR